MSRDSIQRPAAVPPIADAEFVFHLDRCAGCGACVLACAIENHGEQELPWRRIVTYNAPRRPDWPCYHLSLACNHCQDPTCLRGCPARAYRRDAASGAIVHDPEKCLGCRYCTWVCPFDAPGYNARRGIVEKCHFCHERLAAGEEPACAAACPLDALQVVAVTRAEPQTESSAAVKAEQASEHDNAPESGSNAASASEAEAGRKAASGSAAVTGSAAGSGSTPVPGIAAEAATVPARGAILRPRLRLLARRRGALPPRLALAPERTLLERLFPAALPQPPRKITLADEWALLLFTLIALLLVSLHTGALLTPQGGLTVPAGPEATLTVPVELKAVPAAPAGPEALPDALPLAAPLDTLPKLPPLAGAALFLAAGLAAMAFSALHLGQKRRMWRAISNLTGSPLSREILFFSLFLGLALLDRLLAPGPAALRWSAAAAGFLSLYAADRIYQRIMRVEAGNFHSAQLLFTGLFLTGLVSGRAWLAIPAGLLKLYWYLSRKIAFYRHGRRARPLLSAVRLLAGMAVPLAAALYATPPTWRAAALLLVIAAEVIDRIEFYDELEVITPEREFYGEMIGQLRAEK